MIATKNEFNLRHVLTIYPDLKKGLKEDVPGFEEIVKDRYDRMMALKEKYIIIKENNGRTLFYQRPDLQKQGFEWTRYSGNALTFDTKEDADEFLQDKSFKRYASAVKYV